MIDCKEYTKLKKEELKEKISKLDKKPILVVIQIGDNPSSNSYIKGKKKDCEEVGIFCQHRKFDENITNEELEELIKKLNNKKEVDGIILQLPVPKHIDVKKIQEIIRKEKDVDGFNKNSEFSPCTPLGVINYLKYNNYDFCGKNACVIGRSDIVGRPLAKMLLDLNCTVTVCHSKTDEKYLYKIINGSDIVFTCIDKIAYFDIGSFNLLQNIIDIGLGKDKDGKLQGNIKKEYLEFLTKNNKNKIIVSGIGGVGLLTRLELLNNTYKAFKLNNK